MTYPENSNGPHEGDRAAAGITILAHSTMRTETRTAIRPARWRVEWFYFDELDDVHRCAFSSRTLAESWERDLPNLAGVLLASWVSRVPDHDPAEVYA